MDFEILLEMVNDLFGIFGKCRETEFLEVGVSGAFRIESGDRSHPRIENFLKLRGVKKGSESSISSPPPPLSPFPGNFNLCMCESFSEPFHISEKGI